MRAGNNIGRRGRFVLAVSTAIAGLLVSGGCTRDRTPLMPGSPQFAPPRAITWGVEQSAFEESMPVECSSENPVWWWAWTNQCGGVNRIIPLPAGSGAREIRVRLSGTVELQGSCGAQPTGHPFGPLGVPYFFAPGFSGTAYDFYSLMMSFAYLDDGFNVRRIALHPIGNDSTVAEGVIASDWPGRSIVLERGQPIRVGSGCVPVGGLRVEVFVRDEQLAPQLSVTCAPLPTVRGDSITCTVGTHGSLSGADSLRAVEWSFRGHARTDGDLHSLSWAGRIVSSGLLRVAAEVNGTPADTSVLIQVTDRRWPKLNAGLRADSLSGDGIVDLPAIPNPDTSYAIGYTIFQFADSHVQRSAGRMPYSGHIGEIKTGPNTGWWYVTGPLDGPYWLVHHSNVLNPTNPWYHQQHYGPPGKPTWLPYCAQAQIDSFRRRALLHEGLSSSPISPVDIYQPRETHYTFFADWMNKHDVNKLYEVQTWSSVDTAASQGYSSFTQKLDDIWVANVQEPQTNANRAVVDVYDLVPVTCRAR
jgi:hypothetical protein